MRIAFLTRIDAFTKFGGDTFQIQMYKKYLESSNHIVDIFFDLSIPISYDHYVIVNLDRPLEFIIYYNQLKLNTLLEKTSILTIHHSYEQINFYEKNYRTGLEKAILGLSRTFHGREKVKNLIRGLSHRKLLKYAIAHFFLNTKEIQKEALNLCSVIGIAEGEIETINKDYEIAIENYSIVKNGVNVVSNFPHLDSEGERSIDILIAGRVEPRKNTLNIARYFSNKNYNVKFVGALNDNFPEYCNEFKNLVSKSQNITYLGKVNPEEMISLYCQSKIHLSGSWFEVASLVDLESYAYGCHVISSVFGHTKDYLGENIKYINPNQFDSLEKLVDELLVTPNDLASQFAYILENYTWKKSAENLEKFFSLAI